ncbi:MltA-interacting protein precursor [Pseudodesulfovibrio hydrargyri]|uniref:MltA-interacting protein n=1 Tax=Pseudodesulfovibrio hydrargyri TaxID=2125990 RepID=A0A1J5N3D7_9BACT|nr:MipA/OmpV family protein [Pseudodesulfovibrio hydrargyri]OIQ49336.1 MltA-interacting protein precursor [Pseudodesulfovibrio hydrargyri]
MIRTNKILLLLLASMAFCPALALADDGDKGYDLSLGAGVKISTSEYKGEDAKVSPVPLLNYEGEYLFVHGLTAGAFLYKDPTNELSVNVSYLSQSFDASENDDRRMRLLDDRDSTMMVGAAYSLRGDWGQTKLALSADVLDNNNGFVADASYAYPFSLSFLRIKPFAGVEWTSENYNDYYYGVDSGESSKSGMREYSAGSGFSPYVGLGLKCGLTRDIDISLSTRIKKLSEEITDSPMVDKDATYSFAFGLSYSF